MAIIDLNIGLKRSESAEENAGLLINRENVEVALVCLGFTIESAEVRQSDSEPTLVVSLRAEYGLSIDRLHGFIEALCWSFDQDAIAGRIRFGSSWAGFLIGPKAAEWGGKFIEEYYLAP